MAKFLKEGGGSLRLNGRIIKPGQVFSADPNEIPVAFRDTLVPQDAGFLWGNQEEKILPKVEPPVYTLKPGARAGWFDIVDVNGKKLTEKALKKEDALSLLVDLGVDVSKLQEDEETEEETEDTDEEEEVPVKKTKKAKK